MGVRVIRRTHQQGRSRTVTLPAQWVQYFGSRAGEVIITGESLLIVAPTSLQAEADELAYELERRSAASRQAYVSGGGQR